MKLFVALLVAATVLMSSSAVASSNVFTGAWDSIDADDSYQQLAVGGGSTRVHVHYIDHSASLCLRLGARNGTATIRGTGTISGSTLTVRSDEIRCAGGIVFPTPGGGWVFEHDPVTDTLLVDFGPDENEQPIWITWTRVGSR